VKLKDGIWWKKSFEKGGGLNKEMISFSFFLLLSFVLWYLNSLEKDIEYEMKYPVRYVNLPENRVLVDELPAKLNVFLKGPGYSILKVKLTGSQSPVVLDVSSISYRRVPGSRSLNYYIITSSLIPKLRNQLDTECDITTIKPDTLFFTFDRIISRTVRIVPDVEVIPDKQYLVKGNLIVIPDTVIITGPKQIVDTISYVKTKYKKLKGVNEGVTRTLKLASAEGYTLSSRKVRVTIPVEQFTEAELKVPVRIENCPDSVNIRIFPDAVTVKCMVAVSDYKKIREIPFDVVIDLSGSNLNSSDKLSVEVRNVPSFVSSVRVNPARVDFLIEKKIQ
jgi:YbbR domain-containing protein